MLVAESFLFHRLKILFSFAFLMLLTLSCGEGSSNPFKTSSDLEKDDSLISSDLESGISIPSFVPAEEPLRAPSEVPEELLIIWEVWAHLTRDHVASSEFSPEEFAEAAINGMLEELDDPHTAYVSAARHEISSEDLQGKFEGIGAHVQSTRDGKIVIVSPIAGGPAEAAGIRAGDTILSVDGVLLEDKSLLDAITLIRGPRGTAVLLGILHLGDIDPVEISITRDEIPLESVLVRSNPGDEIAHIRVTDFFADTAEKLYLAINQVMDAGSEGLIIDVRDNPGGLLRSSVDVVSLFVEDGLILSEIDGSGNKREWIARDDIPAFDIPLVVLANEYSASASEILVGAVQDTNRGKVVGDTTFGKGSVSILRPLSNGAGLYITVAHWYTPAGRLIHEEGLDPDIEVSGITDRRELESEQTNMAIQILQQELKSSQR